MYLVYEMSCIFWELASSHLDIVLVIGLPTSVVAAHMICVDAKLV